MKIILSLSQLKLHDACELSNRIAAFRAYHGYDPGGTTTFREWIACTPDVRDWIWACRCIGEPGCRIAVRVAVGAARRALPVFESEFPGDLAPRQAVELVERWLANPDRVVTEDIKAASGAAYVSALALTATESAAKAAEAAQHAARFAYFYHLTGISDAAMAATERVAIIVNAAEEHAAQKADFLAALEMEEK